MILKLAMLIILHVLFLGKCMLVIVKYKDQDETSGEDGE